MGFERDARYLHIQIRRKKDDESQYLVIHPRGCREIKEKGESVPRSTAVDVTSPQLLLQGEVPGKTVFLKSVVLDFLLDSKRILYY